MQLTTTQQQAILIGAAVYLVVGLLEAWCFFRTTRLWWPALREGGIFLEMVVWPAVSLVAGFLLVPLWYFLLAYGGRWVRDCFASLCCFFCRCFCCWRRKSGMSLDAAAAAAAAAADLEAARVVPYEPANEVS